MSLIDDWVQPPHVLHYATIHWSTWSHFWDNLEFGPDLDIWVFYQKFGKFQKWDLFFFKVASCFFFFIKPWQLCLFVNVPNIACSTTIRLRKTIKLSLVVVSFGLRFQHLTVRRNSSDVRHPCVTRSCGWSSFCPPSPPLPSSVGLMEKHVSLLFADHCRKPRSQTLAPAADWPLRGW